MVSICHRSYVIKGEIGYEFDARRERFKAAEGEALFLPGSPDGGEVYREDNLRVGSTPLFLVDDHSGA